MSTYMARSKETRSEGGISGRCYWFLMLIKSQRIRRKVVFTFCVWYFTCFLISTCRTRMRKFSTWFPNPRRSDRILKFRRWCHGFGSSLSCSHSSKPVRCLYKVSNIHGSFADMHVLISMELKWVFKKSCSTYAIFTYRSSGNRIAKNIIGKEIYQMSLTDQNCMKYRGLLL